MELCFFNVHSSFSAKRIKITDVNPHLICVLCGGYYIDATTIIECLHSFCKSCIVKYLEKNKYCPICDVQIHKTYPLLNIRSDKTLQNIVYKLVPSLFKDEMQRRVSFYEKNPHLLPSVPEDRGQITDSTPILFPDELLIICLDYHNDKKSEQGPKRYFHCPASMTVAHLGKLIRGKFSLTPTHQVNIFFKEDYLQENLTVMDIVYTYQCRRKVPIRLTYRILELKKKTIKLMPPVEKKEQKSENEPPKNEETKMDVDKEEEKETVKEKEKEKEKESEKEDVKEWKEVQLQISENGVMSVRNMEKSECSPKPAIEAPARVQSTTSPTHPTASMTSTQAKPQNGPSIKIPGTKLTMSHSGPSAPRPSTQPIVSVSKVSKDQVKKDVNVEVNKLSISRVSGKKGETLNKIVSKLSPNERVIGNTSVTIRPVVSPPRPTNIQPKSKDRKPIPTKYKTLTSPTKQWNPSIDRSTMLTLKQNCDMSKPPRFFKMRNMPRFLGNPSSGVKPMYATEESQKPRSPTKLPPPYTPGSPKTLKPYDKTWTPGIPSPAHSSPFLHPSNPYHLLYSGYPYSNDSFNNTELLRSMCASTAFHPSLPPSISMLFNPLHNLRPMDTPPVQRIPRSKSPLKIEDKPDRVPSTSAKSESPKSQPQPNKAIPLPPPPKLNPVKSPEKMDVSEPINNNVQPSTPNSKSEETTSK